MDKGEYVKMREKGLIGLITLNYFRDKGLKISDIDFSKNYTYIIKFITQIYGFSQEIMLNELDIKFNLTITEEIETGRILKIT